MMSTTKQPLLLALPVELRLKVYEYAFDDALVDQEHHPYSTAFPAFLSVSRQIHYEALGLYPRFLEALAGVLAGHAKEVWRIRVEGVPGLERSEIIVGLVHKLGRERDGLATMAGFHAARLKKSETANKLRNSQ